MVERSGLHTIDPLALRYLMTETLFAVGESSVGDVDTGIQALSTSVSSLALTTTRASETSGTSGVVEPAVASTTISAPRSAPTFRHFGSNGRGFLFLTQDGQNEWMSAAALDAFVKTLTALKLTSDDISVFNVSSMSVFPSQDDLFSFFKPRVVVSLGVALPWPGIAPLSVTSVTEYEGAKVYLTHTFEEFLVDADKKRLFWTTIKTLLT